MATVRVLRAAGHEVSVPDGPDVLWPAGVERRLRRRGGQGRPHHARRAGVRRRRRRGRGRACRFVRHDDPQSSGPSCSTWSGDARRRRPGPGAGRTHPGAHRAARRPRAGRAAAAGTRARVAYHHSCHLLRELRPASEPPFELLDAVEGASGWPGTADERCCGFGGLFSLKLPEMSVADGRRQARRRWPRTASTELVGGDQSCLLHLRGRLRTAGREPRAAPAIIDQVLRPAIGAPTGPTRAPRRDRARDAGGGMPTTCSVDLRTAAGPSPTPACGDAPPRQRPLRPTGGSTAAGHPRRPRRAAPRGPRRCAADVIARLPELLERFADNVVARTAATSSGPATPSRGQRATSPTSGAATAAPARWSSRSRWRPRRPTSTRRSRRRASRWSRPTSASGSSSSPASTPSHIIAPAVHLDRDQVARPPQPSSRRGRRCSSDGPRSSCAFAREQLRQSSSQRRPRHLRRATSASPRPARSCSSPTRATAGWSTSLPRVHVAVMGMERVVRDLGRSST